MAASDALSVDFPKTPYHNMHFVAPPTIAEYYYDEHKKSWIFLPEQANGGRVTISDFPPSQREAIATDLWIDANDYSLYVYDGDAMNWIGLTNFGITASVYVDPLPPIHMQPGALWFDSSTGDLKMNYIDRNSRQWIALTGNGINMEISAQQSDVRDIIDGLKSRMESVENNNYFTL